jgi:CRP-like cAMP-binding protein
VTVAAEALAASELFSGLDREAMARLGQILVTRAFRKGQPLFQQGDPGDALYLLTSGAICVYVTSESGDRMVLSTLRPPDVLGEIALLDGGSRSACAEAMEPSTALVLSRATFLQLLREQPPLVEGLLRALGTLVRRLSEQATDFVFLDLPGRVAKVLLRLAQENGADTAAPEITVTQGRLAEMVGGSRQSVNQILQNFSARGLIELGGRRILLTQPAALRKRAGLS